MQKFLPLKSLRVQLTFWFGGLLLLTMSCVAFYVGQIARSEVMRMSGDVLSVRTQASAQLLALHLSKKAHELELLSDFIESHDDALPSHEVRMLLERTQQLEPGYVWLGWVDISGRIVQATDGLLVGQRATQEPWYTGAQNGLFLGGPRPVTLQSNSPERVFDMAVPIRGDNDQVTGVLVAHLDWDWISNSIRSLMTNDKRLESIDLLIVDAQGKIIYPERLTQTLLVPDTVTNKVTYETVPWSDGPSYLTSMATVSTSAVNPGWHIVIRQAESAITRNNRHLQFQILLLSLLAFSLFVFTAYRISKRLSQPIESLVQIARQIEKKPSAITFPKTSGSPELTTLSKAFESMTQSLLSREEELATLNASLESQVIARTDELRLANEQLVQLATTDPLTGLLNRRQFEQHLQEHHRRFLRTKDPYDILMIDADHFKSINDQFGHQTGDQVLQEIARIMKQMTRSSDISARFGGEEFIILIPASTSSVEAMHLGEKIRRQIEAFEFPQAGKITISVGISAVHINDASPAAVISRADAALYQAKAQGRNQVVQPRVT